MCGTVVTHGNRMNHSVKKWLAWRSAKCCFDSLTERKGPTVSKWINFQGFSFETAEIAVSCAQIWICSALLWFTSHWHVPYGIRLNKISWKDIPLNFEQLGRTFSLYYDKLWYEWFIDGNNTITNGYPMFTFIYIFKAHEILKIPLPNTPKKYQYKSAEKTLTMST